MIEIRNYFLLLFTYLNYELIFKIFNKYDYFLLLTIIFIIRPFYNNKIYKVINLYLKYNFQQRLLTNFNVKNIVKYFILLINRKKSNEINTFGLYLKKKFVIYIFMNIEMNE